MSEITKTVDEGICPACKARFDAENIVNYKIGTHYKDCPHCGVHLEIYTSVEYQIQKVED